MILLTSLVQTSDPDAGRASVLTGVMWFTPGDRPQFLYGSWINHPDTPERWSFRSWLKLSKDLGAVYGIRTHGLLHGKQTIYQLI